MWSPWRAERLREDQGDAAGPPACFGTMEVETGDGAIQRVDEAGLFGAGLGSLLALIERAGYRFLVAVAVFLGMFIIRHTPLTPLLTLATNPVTAHTSIAGPTAWLYGPGAVLLALAALLATRVT